MRQDSKTYEAIMISLFGDDGVDMIHCIYNYLGGKEPNEIGGSSHEKMMDFIYYRTIECTDYCKFIEKYHPEIHDKATKTSKYNGSY